MSKFSKLSKQLELENFTNFPFPDFQYLLEHHGWKHKRTTGSHHIYTHPAHDTPMNIQNDKGQAKPYQLRQFKKIIEENK